MLLLTAIMGCAHLGESPSHPSATSPTSAADVPKDAAAQKDAATLPPSTSVLPPADSASETKEKDSQSASAAPSSKSEGSGSSAAKARSSGAGSPAGAKTPAPLTGGSPADKEPPRPALNAPPTLGLNDLEQRLRNTRAIGVFTKLSLKNQIDDLLAQLHAYHSKQAGASLPQLRQRYDLLLQKVIGLLQSGDAALARDISSSREAIWSLLIDPATTSQL